MVLGNFIGTNVSAGVVPNQAGVHVRVQYRVGGLAAGAT